MEAVDHLGFIVAAYAAAAAVVIALVGWVALDYYAQRRALADLERRGHSRYRPCVVQGRGDRTECLGVVVRRVPRRGAAADAAGAGSPRAHDRHQLQGPS